MSLRTVTVYKTEAGENLQLDTVDTNDSIVNPNWATQAATYVYIKTNDLVSTVATLNTSADIPSIGTTNITVKKDKIAALTAGTYTGLVKLSDGTRIKYFKFLVTVLAT